MSENKKVRITKAQKFEAIKAMLTTGNSLYGVTPEDAVAAIDHELELLAKKNASSSGEKKPTEVQKQNEVYKEKILEFLSMQEAPGVTASVILRGIPELYDYNVQKVSALLRQLKAANRVVSDTIKGGKTVFRLA